VGCLPKLARFFLLLLFFFFGFLAKESLLLACEIMIETIAHSQNRYAKFITCDNSTFGKAQGIDKVWWYWVRRALC
jgi:hypothetical protein